MLRLQYKASFAVTLLATALSVTWAGTSVLARLTDSVPVDANTFTTAASFCAGSTNVLQSSADAYVDQEDRSNVSTTNFGTGTSLYVMSWNDRPSNQRIYANFALPTIPAGCSVTSATLALTTISGVTGRTLQAYRAAAAWTETGVTWSNQPGFVAGSATTAASSATVDAVVSWTVTNQVQAMYPSSTFGFVVKDSVEDSSAAPQQRHHSRTGTVGKRPTLTVVIG